MSKRALVIFSGGQDSTTVLFQCIEKYGVENVETITFSYGQRHDIELEKSKWIAADLGVKQTVIDTSFLSAITKNSLVDESLEIAQTDKDMPNTFVAGRNALFLTIAGSYAYDHDISEIYLGVCETDFSGYPDCRKEFILSQNQTLNLAMDTTFHIHTPLMYLTKKQTWELADKLGRLAYIKNHTHTCYEGVEGGCHECPSCKLREESYNAYIAEVSHENL